VKYIIGILQTADGRVIPHTARSTMQQCEEDCKAIHFPDGTYEALIKLGYKIVQAEITVIE